jgi:hypothetical protein
LRRKQDALKSALKRLKPSIETTSTWDEYAATITQLPEYQDLKHENLAKEVFEKVVARIAVCLHVSEVKASLLHADERHCRKRPKRSE